MTPRRLIEILERCQIGQTLLIRQSVRAVLGRVLSDEGAKFEERAGGKPDDLDFALPHGLGVRVAVGPKMEERAVLERLVESDEIKVLVVATHRGLPLLEHPKIHYALLLVGAL